MMNESGMELFYSFDHEPASAKDFETIIGKDDDPTDSTNVNDV